MRSLRTVVTLSAIALSFGLAACGDDDSSEESASATATTKTEANAPCDITNPPLKNAGTLTVGTDKPAYPPYFEDDDPSNGKGFESAVAYAVANELGIKKENVKWTVVPFNSSYAPGSKDFDFDINQISITPERAEQVDFSEPYYAAPQAVIALNGTDAAKATDLAGLKDAKLGVQVGTTSLDAVNDLIKPSTQPQVFNDSNDTVAALKNKRVDAIVVDLPTALYLTAAEISDSTIVGQFTAGGGDEWGLLAEKDSKLTSCLDEAIGNLRSSGKLDEIQSQYLGENTAPTLN